jgi:hypothetical protein
VFLKEALSSKISRERIGEELDKMMKGSCAAHFARASKLMTTSRRTTTRHTDHPRPVVVSHRLSCARCNHRHCFCPRRVARAFPHCMYHPQRPPFASIIICSAQVYDTPPPDTPWPRIKRSRNEGAIIPQCQSLLLCWHYVQGSQAKGPPSRRGRHPRRIETREQELLP